MEKTQNEKENNFAFIDGQNLYRGVEDDGWRLDYKKLFRYLKYKYNVKTAYIFLGYIEELKPLYSHLKKCGFTLVFKETSSDPNGKAKGNVDVDLTLKTIVEINDYNKAVLVTSDGDFAVLVKYLKLENKFKSVVSPTKNKCSYLLKKAVAGRILYLNEISAKVGKKKKRASAI